MSATQPINNHTSLQQLKFLIAEDSGINAKLLEVLFLQQNIKADFVENGQQLIELLAHTTISYDVILMDLEMPEMNGWDAAVYIRSTMHSSIPIIAMSGHIDKEEKEKCIQAGMNEYVAKPINMAELFDKVRMLTDTNLSHQQAATTAAQKQKEHINLTYIKSLSRGNTVFEIKILEVLLEELPPQLQALTNATHNADCTQAANIIHKMKSSVNMLGLGDISDVLALMETDLDENKVIHSDFLNQLSLVRNTLRSSFDELRTILENTRANIM